MKKCSKCGEIKELSEFHNDKSKLFGVANSCKECKNKATRDYLHTRPGLVTQIYTHQKETSKRRDHPKPSYSKEELRKWIYLQPNFEALFDEWVKSGFEREKSPSIDRIKDELPYMINNIRLVSWGENKRKEHKRRREGKTAITKSVIGVHTKTKEVVRFLSGKIASRELGIRYETIIACCTSATVLGKNGNRYMHKSAGGYAWRYE